MSSKLTTQPTGLRDIKPIDRLQERVDALKEVCEALTDRIEKIELWHTIEKQLYRSYGGYHRSMIKDLFWAAQAKYEEAIQEDDLDWPDTIYFFTPEDEE